MLWSIWVPEPNHFCKWNPNETHIFHSSLGDARGMQHGLLFTRLSDQQWEWHCINTIFQLMKFKILQKIHMRPLAFRLIIHSFAGSILSFYWYMYMRGGNKPPATGTNGQKENWSIFNITKNVIHLKFTNFQPFPMQCTICCFSVIVIPTNAMNFISFFILAFKSIINVTSI